MVGMFGGDTVVWCGTFLPRKIAVFDETLIFSVKLWRSVGVFSYLCTKLLAGENITQIGCTTVGHSEFSN